ncbi:endonuclease/exonuclease/phosphatase family protein [Rapidithrix thailandica]|uniref:Endonuclease/exonuclease/phosphatase family protein n=1 Tax=Rapidithrix thailandica TaxID=413964 RepID=A0AAW9SM47_9BACT
MLMINKYYAFLLCLFFAFSVETKAQEASYDIYNIAFYNLENLFDTVDNPEKKDDDFLPEGSYKWTEKRYREKLARMAKTIGKVGAEKARQAPVIFGVAEVENQQCLKDLITHPPLNQYNYAIALVASPDKRGINVGLVYRTDLFTLSKVSARELWIEKAYEGFATRNQLLVEGELADEKIAFLVNHWPSRAAKSRYREAAGTLQRSIIDSLRALNPALHIVTMGDFNDDPVDKSLVRALGAKGSKEALSEEDYLYNPMYKMYKNGLGTLAYRDNWNLFDQIIISKELVNNKEGLLFYKSDICNFEELKNPNGRYKGYPFRTYAGGAYAGGYSDHFPVVIYLIKKKADL